MTIEQTLTEVTSAQGGASVLDSSASIFRADAHFRMGSSHEAEGTPCQDYALADMNGTSPFAIVSDGCSTSGRTDIGARLLTLSARLSLRDAFLEGSTDLMSELRVGVLARVSRIRAELDLAVEDLDATLGVMTTMADGGVTAMLMGDGVVAVRTGGGIEAVVLDWAGNMPGYPMYLADPRRLNAFIDASEAFGRDGGRPPLRVSRFLISEGEMEPLSVEGYGAIEGLMGISLRWGPGIDVACVMTDGVQQVGGMPWFQVVEELLAVKSARAGAFMARRMSRSLAGMAKAGHRPVDDIAAAALAAT